MDKPTCHEVDESYLAAERERLSVCVLAKNTSKSYADAWDRFTRWCNSTGRKSLPATSDTISLWITSMLTRGLKVTTAQTRLSAVHYYLKQAGIEPPESLETRKIFQGTKRLRREKPNVKRPVTADELWRISRLFDLGTARGVRDRALLVFGLAGAFRRSELANLDVDDVVKAAKGLRVTLQHSKTDQFGEGRIVAVFRGTRAATCPVRCLEAWLHRRGGQPGPLFLTINAHDEIKHRRMGCQSISDAVKKAVRQIGLDPHFYAGHSLRAGYCTEAAENGATEMAIMQQTGHKSPRMVHRYVRPVRVFATNPLAGKL